VVGEAAEPATGAGAAAEVELNAWLGYRHSRSVTPAGRVRPEPMRVDRCAQEEHHRGIIRQRGPP
jgi:hypothetical protein